MSAPEPPLSKRPPRREEYRGIEAGVWGAYDWWTIRWPGNVLDGSQWTDDKAKALIDWQLDNPTAPNPFPWLKIIPVADRKPMGSDHAVKQETQPTAAVETPQPIQAEVPEQKPVTTAPPAPVVPAQKKPTAQSKKMKRQASNMKYDENGKLIF